ncbi:PAS domain S-box protein [Desulforegula conservatrix]|uniref:PAS domain S-box protein n=1 Tax=Desulforegula conservatrix TaxID=153026 RepID=UPI000419E3C4|nr:PAS domain S-box protein [Desulforegula conservatrix]
MSESSLKKPESIFYRAFNNESFNIIMFFSTIDEGVYIDVNEAFVRAVGFPKHEIIGRTSVELGLMSDKDRERIKKKLADKGRLENFEVEFRTNEKKILNLSMFGEIVSIGGQQSLFTIVHDVTELKNAKSELEKEKTLLQVIFESTPDALVIKDLNSVYQKANPAFCRSSGITEAQAVGKTDFDFFPETEALKYRAEDQEIIKTGISKEFERKFRQQDNLVWYQTIKTPVMNSRGSISGVLCSVRDISRKKRFDELLNSRLCISNYSFSSSLPELFQKVLSESERLTESQFSFFHFVDDINKMIHLNTWSENAVKVCAIKTHEKSYGLDKAGVWADCVRGRKPVIHNDYPDLDAKKGLPPGHTHISRELVVPVFEGEKIVATLGVGNKRADYDQVDVEVVTELAKMAWDILGRKEAEKRFGESQRVLKTLMDNLPGIVFRCRVSSELKLEVEFVSDGCTAITGYSPDEFTTGQVNFFDIVHHEDSAMIARMVPGFFNNNRPYEVEFRVIHRNGAFRHLWGRGIAVSSMEGAFVTIEGFISDITELRSKDAELRRFASAMHQVADTIIITDKSGVIKYVNPSFEKTSGYGCSEVMGKKAKVLNRGALDDGLHRDLWSTIESGRIWSGRFVSRKKDGSLYTEEATISPVFDDNGEIIEFVAVKRDITNELNLEAQIFQSQKMEAIGALSGGIAHDFNNILFPLIGFSDILQQDLPADSHLQDYVSEILTASFRAKELVKQILAFSRQSKAGKTVLRIQNILGEVVRFSRATLPSTITVRTFINTKCRPVLADSTQIHQIAMNLVTNALHAMEENGGVLTIALDEIQMDNELSSNLSIESGLYIRMAVSDTGCGIAPAIQGRIFDPYFTTKDKGTGIGLAVVHGIVKSHGGNIELQSTKGEGTSFVIYFPCLMEDRKDAQKDYMVPTPCGSEKILVVDDEEAIARMVRQMLERLGYTVTVRTSSAEAFQLFKDDPYRFDLVITDMTMPKMTGDQLSMGIKKIRAGVPIIICTGFSEKMDADKARMLGIEGFVLKPILQNELAVKVREVLDNKEK